MILPIDLKFLIVSYLNINTIIKLGKIDKDDYFWGPLIKEIKMLQHQANEMIIEYKDNFRIVELDNYISIIAVFTRLFNIFNNVLVVSNIRHRMPKLQFFNKVDKMGFKVYCLDYIIIITANYAISINEVASIRSYTKYLPHKMLNQPKVSRFTHYLLSK